MHRPSLRPLVLTSLLAAIAACSDPATAPPPVAGAAGPRHDLGLAAGATYYVHNACTGKLLDVENVSKDDGARVHLWAKVNGPNQQWALAAVGDGSYTLTSVNSGKVLDAFGWDTTNGAAVGQWAANGGANQHWQVTDVGNGYATLNPMYAPAKALDVQGADTANGTPIQLFAGDGTCAQQWRFEAVGGPTSTTLSLLGVNLEGGADGTGATPYPSRADVDYFVTSKGLNIIRFPFKWERIQPVQYGPLDSAALAPIDDVVSYATGRGVRVIIDPHNFGYRWNSQIQQDELIGGGAVPNASFADFWGKLAAHYVGNPRVLFGVMNEPHDQTAAQWIGTANAAIAAIRGVGATQEILVPGTYWDGALSWTTTDNANVVGAGVSDPGNNYAFEVHQYLDPCSCGGSSAIQYDTIGVQRLRAVTDWATANHKRLFLGEFGVSTDSASLSALEKMLAFMEQHRAVWQGATYYAGGPGWPPDKMGSLDPVNGVEQPQLKILSAHAPREAQGGAQVAQRATSTTRTSR